MDNPTDPVEPAPTPSEEVTQIPASVPASNSIILIDEIEGPKPAGKDLKTTDAKTKEEIWEEKYLQTPKIVKVKWLDYEHFKNRYQPGDGLEIIQVLRGHQSLNREVSKEEVRRKHPKRSIGRINLSADSESSWIDRVRIQSPPILLMLARLTGHEDDTWNINRPMVFLRPFRTFYYYLPVMKRCLKILEKAWGKFDTQEDGERAAAGEVPSTGKRDVETNTIDIDTIVDQQAIDKDQYPLSKDEAGRVKPEDALSGSITDSLTAFRHLRKYVEFVEKEILPEWELAATTTHQKFRFDDLWMVFQPGELLYVPPKPKTSQRAAARGYQTALRLASMVTYPMSYHVNEETNGPAPPRLDVPYLELCCYYIDYNGYSYGPVERNCWIWYYQGEKDITSLDMYPMRFAKGPEEMKSKLREQGEKFQMAIQDKHLYYDGWTLDTGPMGDQGIHGAPPPPPPGGADRLDRLADILAERVGKSYTYASERNRPEHIDGDVMVDFIEGYKANTSIITPVFTQKHTNDDNWPTVDDLIMIRCFADGPKSEIVGEFREIVINDLVGDFLRKRHKKESKLLQEWRKGNVSQVEGDDILLLPRRGVAYAFRERKFVMLDVHGLRPVRTLKDVFGDLKIKISHKRMVKSLVKAHFKKQKLQKQLPGAGLNQDLIQGKGAGLFILLHGVPGVGNTATAEAVAQANKKPLFVITCGDLGFAPKEVDETLRDIFRLAHLWDCVLLLDEADIFLSRREVSDLQRNALVSVFLRVLEYYSGILFLTTNRVGALDEAFKSRIHLSLYYPKLSREQTLSIFKVNIDKLHEIEKEKQMLEARANPDGAKRPPLIIDKQAIMNYATELYDTYEQVPHLRWNGRQIRNAFQIAYSLADFDLGKTSLEHWEEEDANVDLTDVDPNATDGPQAVHKLDDRHFEIVAKAIEDFDHYLEDAMQGTDVDHARSTGIRADDHDSRHWDVRPAYRAQYRRGRDQGNEPSYRRARPGPVGPSNPTRPSQARPTRQSQSHREYISQGQADLPYRQEYPPRQRVQPRSQPRAAPEGLSQPDSNRLRARGSPSNLTPRSQPSPRQQYDSGYEWSTQIAPNPALPDDDYDPRNEEGDFQDQDFSGGEEQYYEVEQVH